MRDLAVGLGRLGQAHDRAGRPDLAVPQHELEIRLKRALAELPEAPTDDEVRDAVARAPGAVADLGRGAYFGSVAAARAERRVDARAWAEVSVTCMSALAERIDQFAGELEVARAWLDGLDS